MKRKEHQPVAAILNALDANQLRRYRACFGGGTRIVLALGEYRVSRDLDFICGDWDGFATLRKLCRFEGPQALFTGAGVTFPREPKVERDAIRFLAANTTGSLKCEILFDPRFSPEPDLEPAWGPVPLLKRSDCVTVKLLANDDRLYDRSTAYRDLIDLAAMRAAWYPTGFPRAALDTADFAYHGSASQSLGKALAWFGQRGDLRRQSFQDLQVANPGLILEGLRQLGQDFGPELADMDWKEEEALEQYRPLDDEGPPL